LGTVEADRRRTTDTYDMLMRAWLRGSFIVLACLVVGSCAGPEPAGTSATIQIMYDLYEAKSDAKNNYVIDGFISYVSVSGPDVNQTEELPSMQSVSIQVPQGGEYQIGSWISPCEADCSNLDPPEDACAATVSVPDGATLNILIRRVVAEPCTIWYIDEANARRSPAASILPS
jgi:hypothetical protein